MESVWVSVWVFRPKTDTVIKKKIPRNLTVSRENLGAAIQIRTGDLILTKDVLYHLSHSSMLVPNGNSVSEQWRPGTGSNRRPLA